MPNTQNTADRQPSLVWICTNPSLFAFAKATLEDEYIDIPAKLGNNMACSGHMGKINVIIHCLQDPLNPNEVTGAVQSILASSTTVESFLIGGFGTDLIDHDITLGDLVISQPDSQDKDVSEPISTRKWSVSRQVAMLQREVGADGHWLSNNPSSAVLNSSNTLQLTHQPISNAGSTAKMHYRRLDQANWISHNKTSWDKLLALKNALDDEATVQGLKPLPIDVILVLAVSKKPDVSNALEDYAALNAASYAKELIRSIIADDLKNSISSLRGTETMIPPHANPRIPPFEACPFPRYGDAVLLVTPTANKSKGLLLRDAFADKSPEDIDLHSVIVPLESGVGEQPYNEAGVIGAHSRISNALRRLNTPEYQETLVSKRIGTIIVASIESYIQIDAIERPTDFGLVVIHNATTGKTTAEMSWGVTAPPAYVERARRFGFEGNPNYGRVTVGQILAAHVPGLDKADWQGVLAGRSRYELLSDAIKRLKIPW